MHDYFLHLDSDTLDTPDRRTYFTSSSGEVIPFQVVDGRVVDMQGCPFNAFHKFMVPHRGYDVLISPGEETGHVRTGLSHVLDTRGYVGVASAGMGEGAGKGKRMGISVQAPLKSHQVTYDVGPAAIDSDELTGISTDLKKSVTLTDRSEAGDRFDCVVAALLAEIKKKNSADNFEVGDDFNISLADLGIGGYDRDGIEYSDAQKPFAERRVKFLENLEKTLNELLTESFRSKNAKYLLKVSIKGDVLTVKVCKPGKIDHLNRSITTGINVVDKLIHSKFVTTRVDVFRALGEKIGQYCSKEGDAETHQAIVNAMIDFSSSLPKF